MENVIELLNRVFDSHTFRTTKGKNTIYKKHNKLQDILLISKGVLINNLQIHKPGFADCCSKDDNIIYDQFSCPLKPLNLMDTDQRLVDSYN